MKKKEFTRAHYPAFPSVGELSSFYPRFRNVRGVPLEDVISYDFSHARSTDSLGIHADNRKSRFAHTITRDAGE